MLKTFVYQAKNPWPPDWYLLLKKKTNLHVRVLTTTNMIILSSLATSASFTGLGVSSFHFYCKQSKIGGEKPRGMRLLLSEMKFPCDH